MVPPSRIKIRPLEEKDRAWIARWGRHYDTLDPRCCYVVVNIYEIPLLIAYLLPTQIGVAYIANVASSPHLEKENRRNYIKSMVQYLLGQAKLLGMRRVVSSPTLTSLTKVFVDEGFAVYERKADFVWKDI